MCYRLELEKDPEILEKQDKFIREGIIEFNAPFIGSKLERFSIYVKDNEDKIIGGVIVFVYANSIFIDILWISQENRGLGIGSELLLSVETETIKRGINVITLDTFSFQAEGFYLKQGYEPLGIIKNYIEGHDRIFFRKQL
jgi:GNAT superfamily N-acetyltransferase